LLGWSREWLRSKAKTVANLGYERGLGRMSDGKFRHVPAVEQDRLIGVVSIGDVVKHRLMEMERESEALRDYIQTA